MPATCIWFWDPQGHEPLRFRVTLNGKPPGADHGADCDEMARHRDRSRLYQLIRQKRGARDRLFRIEFLSPGVQAFSFTFG